MRPWSSATAMAGAAAATSATKEARRPMWPRAGRCTAQVPSGVGREGWRASQSHLARTSQRTEPGQDAGWRRAGGSDLLGCRTGGAMDFRALGPLELWANAEALPLVGAKTRALLAVLLLRASEVVARDVLIDALWGDDPPATATHTLDAYVHRLRKALE